MQLLSLAERTVVALETIAGAMAMAQNTSTLAKTTKAKTKSTETKTKTKPAEEPKEEKTEEPKLTLPFVREQMKKYNKVHGIKESKEIIQKIGSVDKLVDMDEKLYPELLAAIEKGLENAPK